jgi:hypothetical protein
MEANSMQLFSRTVLAIVFLSWFSVFADADTNCTGKCASGHSDCIGWCLLNNRTTKSGEKCQAQCDAYWYSGKNPQSIGRPNPTNPTNGTVGPGRLKNPPTTVSDPTPPSHGPVKPVEPVKPGGISNPGTTNSGNNNSVILERKNDSGGQDHGHK